LTTVLGCIGSCFWWSWLVLARNDSLALML
jgi:hypothetical protein